MTVSELISILGEHDAGEEVLYFDSETGEYKPVIYDNLKISAKESEE